MTDLEKLLKDLDSLWAFEASLWEPNRLQVVAEIDKVEKEAAKLEKGEE